MDKLCRKFGIAFRRHRKEGVYIAEEDYGRLVTAHDDDIPTIDVDSYFYDEEPWEQGGRVFTYGPTPPVMYGGLDSETNCHLWGGTKSIRRMEQQGICGEYIILTDRIGTKATNENLFGMACVAVFDDAPVPAEEPDRKQSTIERTGKKRIVTLRNAAGEIVAVCRGRVGGKFKVKKQV